MGKLNSGLTVFLWGQGPERAGSADPEPEGEVLGGVGFGEGVVSVWAGVVCGVWPAGGWSLVVYRRHACGWSPGVYRRRACASQAADPEPEGEDPEELG